MRAGRPGHGSPRHAGDRRARARPRRHQRGPRSPGGPSRDRKLMLSHGRRVSACRGQPGVSRRTASEVKILSVDRGYRDESPSRSAMFNRRPSLRRTSARRSASSPAKVGGPAVASPRSRRDDDRIGSALRRLADPSSSGSKAAIRRCSRRSGRRSALALRRSTGRRARRRGCTYRESDLIGEAIGLERRLGLMGTRNAFPLTHPLRVSGGGATPLW